MVNLPTPKIEHNLALGELTDNTPKRESTRKNRKHKARLYTSQGKQWVCAACTVFFQRAHVKTAGS